MSVQFNDNNASLKLKRVYYEGTDSLLPGYLLCYNNDVTTDMNGTTVAEGSQCQGKFLRVEKPATANLMFFAGVVVTGVTGPAWVDIYEPNGTQMAVYTDKACTLGTTVLGLSDGSYKATSEATAPCILANETIDRSSTNGLVLAVVNAPQAAVTARDAAFFPARQVTTGYKYGFSIDGGSMLTGTTASKSYVLSITGSKTGAATGDSNDAMLKLTGSNYGACENTFVFAGINAVVNNRAGGTLGRITNTISVSLKQGSTAEYAYGLQVDAQDLAATAKTEFGGIDLAINREGLAATTEFGMQLRTRGTINTAINTAFRISKDATDHGFINLFNIETDAVDVIAASGDITFTSADKLIPIVFNGATYYLVATDNV